MENNEKQGRAPDYKGDGVAVWVNQTKDGKQYLSIAVLNSIRLAAFKNQPEQPKEVKMA